MNTLVRFGSPGTKYYLHLTIAHIDDPSYVEYLAARLREVGREDVATLLDGVPDQRALDVQAVGFALRGAG